MLTEYYNDKMGVAHRDRLNKGQEMHGDWMVCSCDSY